MDRLGSFAVDIVDGEWHDGGRDRLLRWRRYQPRTSGPTPVVLHSHGLGGSMASGAEWLMHWASWGIAALALEHPGTDARAAASPLALRHLLRIAIDPVQLSLRQHDLRFALDQLTANETPIAIGISGHSYGAVSALRLLGERRGRDDLPADQRIRAAILFSPSARGGSLPLTERFSNVTAPCLHVTGSCDGGIGPGDIDAEARCLPFRHMAGPDQHLLVLEGGSHPVFSGDAGSSATPGHRALIKAATTSFWRCRLLGEGGKATWAGQEASLWLSAGGTLRHK